MSESHAMTGTAHHGGPADAPPHVGWRKYAMIGVILAIITALEVAVFYIDALAPVLVPVLLVLTAGKFFLVVLYYMHLKMDHPIFGRVFWAPMALAVLVVIGLILLFHVLPTLGKFSN
ncbi:MAG TPA: cytochrome C oxidase subunit IV family protein [Longimicrobiales bacterium]|nr:cytochrome C oxidase subunit IV family protein [Longimicrobiales bacterium]